MKVVIINEETGSNQIAFTVGSIAPQVGQFIQLENVRWLIQEVLWGLDKPNTLFLNCTRVARPHM